MVEVQLCPSSRRRGRAKKNLTMNVLGVPVYMQLHTKTTLVFLGGVSDFKDLDVFSHEPVSPALSRRRAVMPAASLG